MGIPTNNKTDLGKGFEAFVDSTFVKIDGVLVKRGTCVETGKSGFIWGDEFFETVDSVRNAMNGIYLQISLKIINPNGEVKKLDKEYTDMYFNGKSGYDEYKKSEQ
jgi:hypothetical protein